MREVYFDGLVGPTHNYSGLSYGNIASMQHSAWVSSPKQAALEGLLKMKRIMDLGLLQAVLPPHERPSIPFLRSAGFSGSDAEVLESAAKSAPDLMRAASSASSMWRANSATVTPSCDSYDGRVHLTVANLSSTLHRSLEAEESYRLFKAVFPDRDNFVIHPPLPFPDEGAANHIRFSSQGGGVHLYVYGRSLFQGEKHTYPARQTREASEAIVRLHGGKAVFAKQNPQLIEKGVFHNDVISCGTGSVLLYHPDAFEETERVIEEIQHHCPLEPIRVDIPVEEAIQSYLFNSQLLTLPDHSLLLLAPEECRTLSLNWLPIPIEYISIRQSMQNGGGPACLRLTIPLTDEEIGKVHPNLFLTQELFETLKAWIEAHYRERLTPRDLHDVALYSESRIALDALSEILDLPVIRPLPESGRTCF